MKSLRMRTVSGPLVLILTLVLVACSQGPAGSDSTSSSASSLGASQVGGSKAAVPDFTVSTGAGTKFSLSDHRGDVVVLYFSFPG
jgi:cytochrome oxidase Cu insertion factor (SCO1/SenC/PrrC family)